MKILNTFAGFVLFTMLNCEGSNSGKVIVHINQQEYILEEKRYVNPETYDNMIIREKRSFLVTDGTPELYRDTVQDGSTLRIFGERNDTIYQLYEIVTELYKR